MKHSPEMLEQKTAQSLAQLQELVLPFGIKLNPVVPATEKKFQSLPEETKQFCLDLITDKVESIRRLAKTLSTRRELEIEMLKMACDDSKLSIPEEFFKIITENDIVEIYDIKTKNQIYRNLEFLNRSSYDFLTIITTPYPELFERGEDNTDKVVERSEWVTYNAVGPVGWKMPDHYLTERLSPQRWKYVMKMGYICPVFSTDPETMGQRVAFVSTLQVDRVGFGNPKAD